MAAFYTEADYENSVVELFKTVLGYRHIYGPDIQDRNYYSPLLEEELKTALVRINPALPEEALSEAFDKLNRFENASLVQKNEVFTNYIRQGIEVRYRTNGEERSGLAYPVDFKNPGNNSFIVANQWSFIENSTKRPDILIFLNGLPVVLMELKSPSREETEAGEGYLQIRNYMQEIPSLFIYNCICVISDHLTSKAGTITSGEDRFMEWKTKDGSYENTRYAQFDTFFEGIFQKERLLDIIENFICFSDEGVKQFKILAGYHQYFAVKKAIESTKKAAAAKAVCSGTPRVRENPFPWFSTPGSYRTLWTVPPLWSLQTATIWTTSFTASLSSAGNSCAKRLFRQKAGFTSVSGWQTARRTALFLPQCRSLRSLRNPFRYGATSLSWRTRPTAASTV